MSASFKLSLFINTLVFIKYDNYNLNFSAAKIFYLVDLLLKAGKKKLHCLGLGWWNFSGNCLTASLFPTAISSQLWGGQMCFKNNELPQRRYQNKKHKYTQNCNFSTSTQRLSPEDITPLLRAGSAAFPHITQDCAAPGLTLCSLSGVCPTRK